MRRCLRSLEMKLSRGIVHPFCPLRWKDTRIHLHRLLLERGMQEGRIKNVLNFKKPHTWVAAIATILVVIVAVSCLTNQKPSGIKTVNPTETVESTQKPVQENTVDAKRNRVSGNGHRHFVTGMQQKS